MCFERCVIKEAEIINFSHSGATIEGDSSSGGGIEDSVENFDAAMRGSSTGGGIEDSVENFDAAMRGKQVGSYVTSEDAK